jgi:hypothetical protein
MAAFKTYRWEKQTFQWHYRINILEKYRKPLTFALATHFGIRLREVQLRCKRAESGKCFQDWQMIRLPRPELKCSLGIIIHELAHLYDYQVYQHTGHQGSFRKSVIKLYVESKGIMTKTLDKVRAEIQNEEKLSHRITQKVIKKNERSLLKKQLRKTPQHKIERLRKRIKKLETRLKRTQTLLKKAKKTLIRQEKKATPGGQPVEAQVQ